MPETKRQLEDEIMELHEHVYDALMNFFNRYEETSSRPQYGGYNTNFNYETYNFEDFYPEERREEEIRELTNEREYLQSLLERVMTATQNLEITRQQNKNTKASVNAKPVTNVKSANANAKPVTNVKPANANAKPANANVKSANANAKPANAKFNSTSFAGVGGCGCRF